VERTFCKTKSNWAPREPIKNKIVETDTNSSVCVKTKGKTSDRDQGGKGGGISHEVGNIHKSKRKEKRKGINYHGGTVR